MKTKFYSLVFFALVLNLNISGQMMLGIGGAQMEQNVLNAKKYVVAVGMVKDVEIIYNGKKQILKTFSPIGSAIITYAKVDTSTIYSFVTARHVINFFLENNLKTIYIRPSWADTIKTTDYFGVEIPIKNKDNTPNTFLYPDSNIDLGCVVLMKKYWDKKFLEQDQMNNMHYFPYNSMQPSYLGETVWIAGYPAHIQSNIYNKFLYCISTLKFGTITWKPSPNMINEDLNHITLIESNATNGNSGGPVFSIHDEKLVLEGILVVGYYDLDNVYLDDKVYIDSASKKPFLTRSRAGVSVIEKAENITNLESHVEKQINDFINKGSRFYKNANSF